MLLPGDDAEAIERAAEALASGRLVAFQCLDEAPFHGLPPVELFPLSAEKFRAYHDEQGLGTGVRFELDADGAARALSLEDVTIRRAAG